MNHYLTRIFAITLLVALPLTTHAAVFFQKEQGELFIADPVDDDVYVGAQKITVKESISGDAALFGQVVTVESIISKDLYAAGQAVRIIGSVEDDAHIAGDVLDVTGSIAEDLFAAGQKLTIAKSATVGQDAYLAGGEILVNGTIEGTVRIAGSVVTIGPDAIIKGDLLTVGGKPKIEEGAVITGKQEHKAEAEAAATHRSNALASWIRATLALFVLAYLLLYFIPDAVKNVFTYVEKKSGLSFLTGLVWMLLAIPVAGLLAVTGVGIPLAVILLLTTVIIYLIAAGMGALFIGSIVYRKLSPNVSKEMTWPTAIIGAVIYEGAQMLGVIGWSATLALVLFMFGAIVRVAWKTWK